MCVRERVREREREKESVRMRELKRQTGRQRESSYFSKHSVTRERPMCERGCACI